MHSYAMKHSSRMWLYLCELAGSVTGVTESDHAEKGGGAGFRIVTFGQTKKKIANPVTFLDVLRRIVGFLRHRSQISSGV